MNIEDVKQLSDAELNRLITPLSSDWADFQEQHGFIPCFTTDIELAREAQAKSIEIDAQKFLSNLYRTVIENLSCLDLVSREGILSLLQATPRQISEAVYITLMEVQHEA